MAEAKWRDTISTTEPVSMSLDEGRKRRVQQQQQRERLRILSGQFDMIGDRKQYLTMVSDIQSL